MIKIIAFVMSIKTAQWQQRYTVDKFAVRIFVNHCHRIPLMQQIYPVIAMVLGDVVKSIDDSGVYHFY